MEKYPADWDQRRRTVYQRDGYRCQRCGAGGGPNGGSELHAHHIVPISEGGSHSFDNLVTLCRSCHEAIHGDVFAPQWRGEDEIDGTMPEPSKLPEEVRPYFEYGHAYNAVVDSYEKVIEDLNELDEMLEMAVSLKEQDESLSDEFQEAYLSLEQDVVTEVSTLESAMEEFLDCQTAAFSREVRRVCQQFQKELDESVAACLKYVDQRESVVTGSSPPVEVKATSESSEYDRLIELRDEHSKRLEKSQNTLLEVEELMIAEINRELEEYPGVSVYAGPREEESTTVSDTTSSSVADSKRSPHGYAEDYDVSVRDDKPDEVDDDFDFEFDYEREGEDLRTVVRVITGYWLFFLILDLVGLLLGMRLHAGTLHTFFNIVFWIGFPLALYYDGVHVNNNAETKIRKTAYLAGTIFPGLNALVGLLYLHRRQQILK